MHKRISYRLPVWQSKCKIENWEPPYQICYCLLSSRQQRKTWNSCYNTRPQTSSLQTYGLLTVMTLILWITGYGEYCRNVFIGNLLKIERWWTEAASSSVTDQATDQWRVCLNACVKAKRKVFWIHAMIYCSTTVNNLLWKIHSVFYFTTFSSHDF